jgi:hypothetical protein
MNLAVAAVSIVALGAVAVCAFAVMQMAKMHAAMLEVLSANMRSKDDMVSRAHGSIGMALTEAATRTATAIGDAVQRATTPLMHQPSTEDAAYSAARSFVASDQVEPEPDDLMVDPTDGFYSPDREDLAVIGVSERNPTGVPGFAFDLPKWDASVDIPVPAMSNNGR